MNEFTLGRYPLSSVLLVYSARDEIELAPAYQRISGIWNREKRQLLIDSLLNGFDVPKLYFHAFTPPKEVGPRKYRYAIIDGKQRLQAIWDFIDGKLRTDDDFIYLRDYTVRAKGLTYHELAERYPMLKAQFDATPLDIVTITTDDIEVIEDLFSRLNEAAPLNAPERRNAFGGPLPAVIRGVAGDEFFTKCVPFLDQRYRHRDLAAKFLYLEHSDGIVNTKKSDLDAFVKRFKKRLSRNMHSESNHDLVNNIRRDTELTLASMKKVFVKSDVLLRQVGMVTLYYHLFRLVKIKKITTVTRAMLRKFETHRMENRKRAEDIGEYDTQIDARLLEFDAHSQTPNDAYAIRIRLDILLQFLKSHCNVKVSPVTQ